MLTVYRHQKPAYVMVWAAVTKPWKSPLIFVKQSAKVITNVYIDDILSPALGDMKEHLNMKISPLKRTVLPPKAPIKPKLSAETISSGFGARNCDLFLRLISTQWSSVFGPCWKLSSVAHHTHLWNF